MSPEMTALAGRAVACKAWRWMPGMLAEPTAESTVRPEHTRLRLSECGDWCYAEGSYESVFVRRAVGIGLSRRYVIHALPILDDPATLGCLLALVREAHDLPEVYARTVQDEWQVWPAGHFLHSPKGATEAEALVAALEAAP